MNDIVDRLQTAHDRFLEIARMHELLIQAKLEIEELRKIQVSQDDRALKAIWRLRGDRDYWQKRYWSLFERVSQEISEVARDI